MSLVLPPKARYMIVCDDVVQDPRWPGKPVIVGLMCRVAWSGGPTTLAKMTVYLVLTDGRGAGQARLQCLNDNDGRLVFQSPAHSLSFTDRDPTGLHGVTFRLLDCHFPEP